MIRNNGVYKIRQRNFESAVCPFCKGGANNVVDPALVYTVRLHHFTYPQILDVDIPRCRSCAGKLLPIKLFCTIASIVGGIAGFMFFVNVDLLLALLMLALMALVMWLLPYIFLTWAFKVVYGQSVLVYDVVRIMVKEYGWTLDVPEDIDYSNAPSNELFGAMMNEMLKKCDCEIIDSEIK